MSVYESFNYPEVTYPIAKEMGLTEGEFEGAKNLIGRNPNYIELGIISSMYSEHCSYKSSRVHLAKFPTEAPWVVQGPGENAGVISVDDEGLCVCFKVESHNHPSFIEPFQGAATGVGGILRDVFTMGARPVAAMNSLRFGSLKSAKNRYIFEGVVEGISHYGNCFGVPTVGGEVYFNDCYNGNPLVNAFALGVVQKDRIFLAKAEGKGNPVIYVGAKTGRDGIHGATMASAEFDENSESKRPNVQIGDPFKEKLLLEACLELMKTDYIVGIQDMGAAGLTSSSFEMASKSGSGVRLDLDNVPVRENNMTPYEIMLSETQERMLMVAKKGYEDKVKEIFDKWDLDAVVIGEVTDDGYVRLTWDGEEVAALEAAPLADEAPKYNRPYSRPDSQDLLQKTVKTECPEDIQGVLLQLLANPTIASKRWVWEQYDHMVRVGTVQLPGSDAAVIRLNESDKGVAISSDCNSRYCYLNPYEGGKAAIAESARNVAVSGARPRAFTNCLNFGNTEKEAIMWQFATALEGICEAAKALNTPVVSGNVSLYNETEGTPIHPTPTIVMVGVIDDVTKRIGSYFIDSSSTVYLLGENTGHVGGSEYLASIHGKELGDAPAVDLVHEKAIIEFMCEAADQRLVNAAHDISEGGLAVALAEMTFGAKEIGVTVKLESELAADALLFGENHGRVILEVSNVNAAAVEKLAEKHELPISRIGRTLSDRIEISADGRKLIDIKVKDAEDIWKNSIGKIMK
ncbi:MAG: phosphoribosylformylglycinamidine synthase subunit PurL [Denitrovibrio sp.]|nr:MAG: phosphoribosylformylglycinamidine synthase subunit PurL [Denitrovibrio sp.]